MAAHLPTLFTIWIGFAVDWNRGSLTTSRVKGINFLFLFLFFQIPRALFKSCANVFLLSLHIKSDSRFVSEPRVKFNISCMAWYAVASILFENLPHGSCVR